MASNAKRSKPTNRFENQFDGSDIVIQVQSTKFHCHSLILKLNSPVFSAMFGENFVEGRKKSVDLPGKDACSFTQFLTLLYPLPKDFVLTKDRKAIQDVLTYCDEYQVDTVKKTIDETLALQFHEQKYVPFYTKHSTRVLGDLLLADQFGLEKMHKCCMDFLVDDHCDTYEDTVYKDLSKDVKYELIIGKLKKLKQTVENRRRFSSSSSSSSSKSRKSEGSSSTSDILKRMVGEQDITEDRCFRLLLSLSSIEE